MAGATLPFPARYRKKKCLGRGALGEVYLVEDRTGKVKEPLALKVCRAPERSGALRRFQREFVTLSRLRHPALPAVHDFGVTSSEVMWFTYGYVPGEDIVSWSARAPAGELCRLARELCDVLTFIHSRGILHLDIKPSNVIVTPARGSPRPKLIDFGIVRSIAETEPPAIAGTLPYVAPEVLRGDAIGPPADFFSLGVTIFECLFRQRPFPGSTIRELRRAHETTCPRPPREWTGGSEPELEGLIWRLLARDPKNRLPQLDGHQTAPAALAPYLVSASPIGREEDIGALYAAYLASLRGEGETLFLLEGEAGLGKTRVLRECQRTVQVAGGRFLLLSPGDLSSLSDALIAELRQLGGPAAAFRRFRRKVCDLPPPDAFSSELWLLRHWQDRTRYFEALWELLAAVLRNRPTFFAFEDAHRADQLSLELIADLARRLYFQRRGKQNGAAGKPPSVLPIFFCLTVRPEDIAQTPLAALLDELTESPFVRRTTLRRLTVSQVRQVLTSMFGVRSVPSDLTRTLFRLSGGNPLILEETLRFLLDQGDAVYTPGKRLRLCTRPTRVPRSVDDLLRARLTRLSPAQRKVAGLVSASPKPLPEKVVLAVSSADAGEVRRHLRALEELHVIVQRPAPGGPVVEFSHWRLREILYGSLRGRRRQSVHRSLGEALESVGEAPAELAFHFLAAQEADRALGNIRKAEAELRGRGDTETLRRLYEGLLPLLKRGSEAYRSTRNALIDVLALASDFKQALSLLGKHARSPEECLKRGLLRSASGDHDGALKDLTAVRSTMRRRIEGTRSVSSGAVRMYARASLGLCGLKAEKGYLQEGLPIVDEAIEILEGPADTPRTDGGDRVLLSALYGRKASLLSGHGDEEQALACFQRSHALISRDPPSLEKAGLCGNLANLYTAKAQYGKAARFYERALSLAEAVGARDLQALVNANLGLLYLYQWDLGKAEEVIARAIVVAESSGSPRYATFARFCLGVLRSRQGRYEEAESLFRRELKRVTAWGDRYQGVNFSYQLAYVALDRGKVREALALCRKGMKWAEEMGRARARIEGHLAFGFVYQACGRAKEALKHLEAARSIREGRHPHNDAETTLYYGNALSQVGDQKRGLDLLAASVEAFRKLRIPLRVAECEARYAHALHVAGKQRQAARRIRHSWREVARLPQENRPLVLALEISLLKTEILLPELKPGSEALRDLFHEMGDGVETARKVSAQRFLWRALAALSEIHRANGNEDLARECCRQARDALSAYAALLPRRLREALLATREARRLHRAASEETPEIPVDSSADLLARLRRLEKSYRVLGDENRTLREEVSGLTRRLAATIGSPGTRRARGESVQAVVGTSDACRKARAFVDRIGPTDMPVLLVGESGTGKDLLAGMIHGHSRRHDGPFVSESCAAVPEALWESEFFGHVEGAFTGAVRDTQGLLLRANGGTLYLDEIGDIPLAIQVKLLRVLEEGRVRPVGGTAYEATDFRLIASTRKDLRAEIDRGAFREDLFYRLGGVEFRVAPLRERPEDIPLLVDHFSSELSREAEPIKFSREALDALMAYSWPGNVRELKNEVRRLTLLAGATVAERDLALPAGDEIPELVNPEALDRYTFPEAKQLLEKAYFLHVWDRCGGSAQEVARLMGVHVRSV